MRMNSTIPIQKCISWNLKPNSSDPVYTHENKKTLDGLRMKDRKSDSVHSHEKWFLARGLTLKQWHTSPQQKLFIMAELLHRAAVSQAGPRRRHWWKGFMWIPPPESCHSHGPQRSRGILGWSSGFGLWSWVRVDRVRKTVWVSVF